MSDAIIISEYLKNNKTEKARKLIEKNFKDNMKLYFYYLGLSFCADRDYNKAILFLCASKNYGLSNHLIYYNLGVAYLGKEDYENAEKNFNESILIEKTFYNNYINLCYIYIKKNDFKRAYRTIKTAITFSNNEELLNIEKKLLKCICIE